MPNFRIVRQINSNSQLQRIKRVCPCGSDIISSGNGNKVEEESGEVPWALWRLVLVLMEYKGQFGENE